MAKCIKSTSSNEAKRVSNQLASQLVSTGKWKYISKSEYRRLQPSVLDVSPQSNMVSDTLTPQES